ncbi:MAG: flagellin [Phycisphaerae bacterium]|nr:flagellin [Phycisphaerae bacterium]
MSRINTNVQSLVAQNALRKNQNALSTSLERLSTGLRINSGADDPAGLIASENLKSEQAGITAAIDNANRATNIVGTAEGGLSEVSGLLTQLQGLITQTANSGGLSSSEKQANQSQVDSILSTINRIAQTTSFEGKHLLNGSLGYTTSGVASTAIQDVQVNAAVVPAGKTLSVNVQVFTSGTTAKIGYTGGTVTGANGVTIQLAGATGSTELSFSSGTTVSSIATSINAVTAQTGVSAVVSGTAISIQSQSAGSDQFVSIKANTGSFTTNAGATGRATGKDATVTINGTKANVDGTNVSYNTDALSLSFDLAKAFNKAGTSSFTVTGGGATFAIGSTVSDQANASIGINDVSTSSLGNKTLGFLSSLASGQSNALTGTNLVSAQNIVNQAINQVSSLRGRLGAFQTYTLNSSIDSLSVAYENASSAESNITDTNFSSETANLTREQVLVSSATTVLSHANSTPSNALTLLANA